MLGKLGARGVLNLMHHVLLAISDNLRQRADALLPHSPQPSTTEGASSAAAAATSQTGSTQQQQQQQAGFSPLLPVLVLAAAAINTVAGGHGWGQPGCARLCLRHC